MFGAKVIHDAQKHAAAVFPQESCGLVINNKYVPRLNVHENPLEHFEISAQGYIWAARRGEIQAVIHSHPDGMDYPSYNDMQSQIGSSLPWCILPRNKQPFWFGDQAPRPSSIKGLRGLPFRYGVHDCYEIVRDYFRIKRNVSLPPLPRRWEWWEDDENVYMDNLKATGFRILAEDEPLLEDDCLLGAVRSKVINHAAIFLGNNLILHHLVDRLSVREPLTRWQKYFTIRVRLTDSEKLKLNT